MDKTKQQKIFKIFTLVILAMALGLTLFLAYEYSQPEPIGCPLSAVGENDCETVRQSPYSVLLGVKLPIWGSLYFGFLFVMFLISIFGVIKFKYFNTVLLLLSLWGVIFETYYTYLQVFKIKALCKWCLMTESLVFAVFFLTLAIFLVTDYKPLIKEIKSRLKK